MARRASHVWRLIQSLGRTPDCSLLPAWSIPGPLMEPFCPPPPRREQTQGTLGEWILHSRAKHDERPQLPSS